MQDIVLREENKETSLLQHLKLIKDVLISAENTGKMYLPLWNSVMWPHDYIMEIFDWYSVTHESGNPM